MKVYTHSTYGDPEKVISLEEVEKPQPKKNQVLVQVKAAPVNDYDWSAVSGTPRSYRLLFGLFRPRAKFRRLGMEVAGIVTEVGPEVKKFKRGDAVYGDTSEHQFGSFAEYLCVNEAALHLKPEKMSFEEAAAISHAAMLAYEGLIDVGKIQPNQQVLINGAGGGMGTFGVQLAKTYNAEVTGVDSGDKFDMMQSLGFDHLIDYKKEDFTKNGIQYDLILDARTTRSTFSYLRALKDGGKYVTVGGRSRRLIQLLLSKGLIKSFTKKSVHILPLQPNKYLDEINALYAEGKIKPIIDGPHPFKHVPQLIKYFGEARHKGKIVISVP